MLQMFILDEQRECGCSYFFRMTIEISEAGWVFFCSPRMFMKTFLSKLLHSLKIH